VSQILLDRLQHLWGYRPTIRVRLTLWYVVLLAVSLVAFSAFLYVSLSRNLYAEIDRWLVAEAEQVSALVEVSSSGRLEVEGGTRALAPGTLLMLYDRSGQRVYSSNGRFVLPGAREAVAQATQGQQTLGTVRLEDGSALRVLTTPVLERGRQVGVLQLAQSQQNVEMALRQLVALVAIALPLTLLLAVAGGLFLAGRALDPIDRIIRTVEQIGAEDLSRRLGMHESRDEVGRLATTFDRMLDRLDRAFQRQRQFTADAAHELRTPLALLTTQADVALERSRKPDEYRAALGSMRADASRMSHLLNDLLTLARADAGQEKLVLEPLDVDALADGVVATMAPLARTRGVRLQRGAGKPALVEADQTRLTQLLINLVDNGLKHTPKGGVVTVSVDRSDREALLRVADTGVGIAAEHLPHLFERFYRVDSARSRPDGGAGLGLAISQWIVQAHRGKIEVESQPGRGTTFTVRLPLARDHAAARSPQSKERTPGVRATAPEVVATESSGVPVEARPT
jgi:heavy metal sensor kinase